ncbi:MAG: hypothetical protein AAF654_05295 [Myxococcota bacterium]
MRSAVVLLLALGAACGTDETEPRAFLTFYGNDNAAFMHLARTGSLGMHFADVNTFAPVGDATRLKQSEVVDLSGLVTVDTAVSGRFSGSAVRVSGFSGQLASSSFRGSAPRASSFSGSAYSAPSFSGTLSSGPSSATCSLGAICDFLQLVCELSQDEECLAEINQCVAEVNAAPIPPEVAPLVCALADYIECVSQEIRTRGLEQLATVNPETLCAEFRQGF